MVMTEFNSFDSLLDDPVEEPAVEPAQEDSEPLIPDSPSDVPNPDSAAESTSAESSDIEDDLLTSYLKGYGIEDPKKIQFENDEGGIDEVDFSSLSKDEQLTMLKELADPGFSDYEKQVISYLRTNNLDLNKLVQIAGQQAVENYLKENPDKVPVKDYKIDDYTDDELYIADLASRFPNLSEDELNSRLDNAKINEELFNKEIADLRQFYKAEEDRQAEQASLAEQQQYEALQNALLDAANRFEDIKLDVEDSVALGVEDEDKQVMLNYLLAQDKDGLSQFDKDLSNPGALIELAWLRTHGRDAINEVTQYWKQQLVETRKELSKVKKQLEKFKGSEGYETSSPTKKSNNKSESVFDIWR